MIVENVPAIAEESGWRKVFVTGQAKFKPGHYLIKYMGG